MPRSHMTVTEFEASPGRALRRAREGEIVEVTARDNVVAVIGPPGDDDVRRGTGGRLLPLEPPVQVDGGIQEIVQEGRG